MPIFAILIIFSLSFYVFYKVKFFRCNRPVEKKWISAKSSVALGSFVGLFGLNQLFLYQTTVTYIVAAIFIVLGIANIIGGIRAYKYYLPLAIDEAKQAN
ncbi:YtpI family protein [Cytobacillus spongiae]|uniref:YtpI family protein n=1 Tax=Cytobacillus spongiae TaxID=2901381 RepID=UPI001F1C1C2D|nr:YtpI family protein [Cytobacillus spongiae]UII57975.1 YtpI family protein [Cytobacillus spongiae]